MIILYTVEVEVEAEVERRDHIRAPDQINRDMIPKNIQLLTKNIVIDQNQKTAIKLSSRKKRQLIEVKAANPMSKKLAV